jgi:hypothetical protein
MQTREIKLPGVRTEICLAVLCELYRVGGESTAYRILLPYEFTKKLSDAGIINARRGRGGGIALIPGFEAVTLADLVLAVEPYVLAREGTGGLLETALYRVMRKTKVVDLFPESALPKI